MLKIAKRVTVNLSERSDEALDRAVEITGNSKTEVINKALQMYVLAHEAQRVGNQWCVRDSAGKLLGSYNFD